MQPYLFPYRGYFELIKSADKFVFMDDAQYINRGWINRNNFPMRFTFRLKKHHQTDKINECYFHDIEADKEEFLKKTGLTKAKRYLRLLEQSYNLSYNIIRTTMLICKDLGIKTDFYVSSNFKHGKRGQWLIDITKALGGDTYVNLPGGRKLYNQEMFGDIKLDFVDTVPGPSILCEL